MYILRFLYIYKCIYLYIYIYIYIYVCVCVCVCIHMYICALVRLALHLPEIVTERFEFDYKPLNDLRVPDNIY